MNQLFIILISLVGVINAVTFGYKYQPPQRQQPQAIPVRQPHPVLPSLVAQYTLPVQAPQLAPPAPPAPPAISLPQPPPQAPAAPISAPGPASIPVQIAQPQNQYLPPQQSHQTFVQSHQQQHQQVYSQAQQQVFSQPQPEQHFAQPIHHQQQFAQPIHHQQQFAQPVQQNVQSFQQPQQTAIITKDIFIHSAPEDNDIEIGAGPQYETGPVRKNYRIVFIKAPTQNLKHTAAALQRAQANNEEKTIIYVLSKKPDIADIQQQLQISQGEQKLSKPEVYFIKYKTQEEAQRAQQEIQAQYDALGGSTHISDEGVAPVTNVGSGSLNVGGPIGGAVNVGASHQSQGYHAQSIGGQTYLPPGAVKK